ncbi:MAG TPA: hypothetical protein VKH44_15050 [Pirellulaceae bacterium]|nr:hypothetical protein [Pirellulaceae bacterium]
MLAVLAVLLLAANFVVGLAGGDFNAAAKRKRETQSRLTELQRQLRTERNRSSSELEEARQAAAAADAEFRGPRARMTLHMMLGAAAALVTVLVNSITVTYFIGTSRWCKEVCDAYQLSPELAQRSTRLKRSTFPWALAGIFSVIVIVGLGAAADPSGANWSRSAEFVLPHYLAAMIGIAIVMAAFWVQINRIAENYGVIEEILADVERIRLMNGLPIEEPSAP